MGIQDPHPLNYADLKGKNIQVDTKTLLLGGILLLLIFVSVSSLVYFLFICFRRRRLTASISPTQSSSSSSPSPPLLGLDKDTISNLPIVSYGHVLNNLSCKIGECSICLGAFRDGEKVKILPTCHHGFHSDCVDTWLLTRPSCPLCRACVLPMKSALGSDIP